MAENIDKTPLENNSDTIAEIMTLAENLPDASGGTDISLGVTGASVGDIIKVKAVDSTGKPTAWEAATAKLANPNALTFTGAVTGSYDGSAPLSVKIPSGGGGGSAGSSEYELLCDQSFDLDGTGTSIEVQLPTSPKGFVLYLAIQVNSPEKSDKMTFSVDGATVPSYFGYFDLSTSKTTVKKWFCDNIVTLNLTYAGGGDGNVPATAIRMVRGPVTNMTLGSPNGDGKLVVGVPGKVGTLYICAYMRY